MNQGDLYTAGNEPGMERQDYEAAFVPADFPVPGSCPLGAGSRKQRDPCTHV